MGVCYMYMCVFFFILFSIMVYYWILNIVPVLYGRFLFIYISFIFWPHCAIHGILVPKPGNKPMPSAVEAWGLNCWTAREVPRPPFKTIQQDKENRSEGERKIFLL